MAEKDILAFQIAGNKTIPLSESGLTYYLNKLASVNARGEFSISTNPSNNDTVTIDGKIYTFKTTLTQEDGSILIGPDIAGSIDNITATINLEPGAGVIYGAPTLLHPSVMSIAETLTTRMDVLAKIAGPSGNSITTTETLANAAWDTGATLANGSSGAPNTDNNFVLPLPTSPVEGTSYKFVTEDNGITVVDDREYFTNWIFTCLEPIEFIVSGAPLGSRKQLKTDRPSPVITQQFNIGLTRTERGKTTREGYIPGTTLELTFFNNAWRGSAFSGGSVRGVGDF